VPSYAGRGLPALALVSIRIRTACALAAETRSLSFVHTHTGEKLSAVYFKDGSYDQAALKRISHLLRDFRHRRCAPQSPPGVLDILFDLQGPDGTHSGPYQVISAYRSPQTNSALRVVRAGVASTACTWKAADRRAHGRVSDAQDVRASAANGAGRCGFYEKSDFVAMWITEGACLLVKLGWRAGRPPARKSTPPWTAAAGPLLGDADRLAAGEVQPDRFDRRTRAIVRRPLGRCWDTR